MGQTDGRIALFQNAPERAGIMRERRQFARDYITQHS